MSITLKRAAYLSGTYKTTPGFTEWETHGVKNIWRMQTYISTVWKPPKNNIKYIILLSAGQQAVPTDAITTGQKWTWLANFLPHHQSKSVDYSSASMTGMLMLGQMAYPFNKNNTLLVLVFKSGLQYESSSSQKVLIIRAYRDWLKGLTNNFNNVETIYLAGISRGGVLCIRLGKSIRTDVDKPEMKILISSIDAVPKKSQNELLCTDTRVYNPKNGDRFAWYSRIYDYFPDSTRNNLWLYHTPSGGVAPGPYDRTFASGVGHADAKKNHTDLWGFYKQTWANLSHENICTDWTHGDSIALKHLDWFYANGF